MVGDPQSLVEIGDDFDDFEGAVRRKMIREIRGAPVVRLDDDRVVEPVVE